VTITQNNLYKLYLISLSHYLIRTVCAVQKCRKHGGLLFFNPRGLIEIIVLLDSVPVKIPNSQRVKFVA
jgi:hypothetical protein